MTLPFVAMFPVLDCEARSRGESLIAVHLAESGGVDTTAAMIAEVISVHGLASP
jgi:hypothetical protein